MHWMSWGKMARAKGMGGMGFQGIREFNTSLLGKCSGKICETRAID